MNIKPDFQTLIEEIDYEPRGRGGRNYGWRNREGAHDNVTSLPPAYLPLTDPIFDYGRSTGQSITGGFVYRGRALGPAYQGRYFFGDYVAGRVFSLDTGHQLSGLVASNRAPRSRNSWALLSFSRVVAPSPTTT